MTSDSSIDFTWDRPFPKMPHHIRITDTGGGIHMANLHEQALIAEVERLRSALAHQAPATEHMESAVEVLRYPGGKDGMTVGRCICGYSTSPGTESRARKALAQHLAAKAPATEDEAAEVEWAVRGARGCSPAMSESSAREFAERNSDRYTLVQRRPGTTDPWREVSS